MNQGTAKRPGLAPPLALFAFLCVVGILSCLAAILAAGTILFFDWRPWLLLLTPTIPLGVGLLLLVLANTQIALCGIAFAICPLGIVQAEIAGITLNLPEVLILVFAAKEGLLFLLRRQRVAKALPWTGLLAYVVAAAIGIHTGMTRGNGLIAVLQDCRQFTEFLVLYLIVVQCVTGRRQIKQILVCYCLGALVLAVHGIAERFTNVGIPLNQVLSDAVYHGGTRSGSFYGATPLGGLLVLTIGGLAALILSTHSRPRRIALGLCSAVCLTAIVFTNTRASWIALLFAFLLIIFSIRKTPGLLLALSVGALVFSLTLGSLVVARMSKLEFSKGERSLLERVDYYTVAWYIFRDYPLRGLGWGAHYTRSDVLANKRFVPRPKSKEIMARLTADESTVHSAYLQLIAKTGLLGLGGFLIFLGNWVRRVFRERLLEKRDELDHNLCVALAAGILGYLLHSGFENFFQWPVMSQSFYLLLGLSTVALYKLLTQGNLSAQPGGT